MCFLRIRPYHAPLAPPGAAPVLTTIYDEYKYFAPSSASHSSSENCCDDVEFEHLHHRVYGQTRHGCGGPADLPARCHLDISEEQRYQTTLSPSRSNHNDFSRPEHIDERPQPRRRLSIRGLSIFARRPSYPLPQPLARRRASVRQTTAQEAEAGASPRSSTPPPSTSHARRNAITSDLILDKSVSSNESTGSQGLSDHPPSDTPSGQADISRTEPSHPQCDSHVITQRGLGIEVLDSARPLMKQGDDQSQNQDKLGKSRNRRMRMRVVGLGVPL